MKSLPNESQKKIYIQTLHFSLSQITAAEQWDDYFIPWRRQTQLLTYSL